MATAWRSKTMVYYAWLAAARWPKLVNFMLGRNGSPAGTFLGNPTPRFMTKNPHKLSMSDTEIDGFVATIVKKLVDSHPNQNIDVMLKEWVKSGFGNGKLLQWMGVVMEITKADVHETTYNGWLAGELIQPPTPVNELKWMSHAMNQGEITGYFVKPTTVSSYSGKWSEVPNPKFNIVFS